MSIREFRPAILPLLGVQAGPGPVRKPHFLYQRVRWHAMVPVFITVAGFLRERCITFII
ncbi:MAG TPA: hypothetical protein PLU94_10465 [Methanoregulaceae archaeon]|nr:hypothetical protein [Methanoregulaceae archaeon]HPM61172.1 hypothetical protein [Methanoregulaceae archaeon]